MSRDLRTLVICQLLQTKVDDSGAEAESNQADGSLPLDGERAEEIKQRGHFKRSQLLTHIRTIIIIIIHSKQWEDMHAAQTTEPMNTQ